MDFGDKEDLEEEEDELNFDPEDLDDIPEGDDLFEEVVDRDEDQEPRTKTAGEVKEKLTSSKNAELIEKATFVALSKVDLAKAKLCEKISGQHFVEYLGDEETLTLFIEALKVYLEQKEVKEPSPFATLLFTLGMALLERFEVFDLFNKKPKEAPKTNSPKPKDQEQEVQGEAASDQPPQYAELKEYQEKRKKFTVNADGKYNHTADGKTYIPVDHANEYPSPVIKAWLDEGKKNKDLVKLLDYGE